jgi:micrococcal nuclease
VKVIDGDTINVDMPDGTVPVTTVRLLGIDAPETAGGSPAMYFASEATGYLRSLASGHEVTLYLDDEADSRGKYGRLLAYVALPDGRFLGEQLLLEGYAYADLRFRHGYYQRYEQLEAVARSLGKGLWREVSREQLPPWLQRMRQDLLSDDTHVD